ncbi:MAG: indolepyruvate ferredoxin oxidoreductase subunit alpha [Clostridia bacterium]|nr:indolepyruvate ferredoxin oxidoreductase subunit alpha [Clostridia bacterium]
MKKTLMTGNEAIARGVYEAGTHFAAAYPGTPSTEILENLAHYTEVNSEWAPNEKVAMEYAIGCAVGGARAFAAMKHVGLNVAADPFFTVSYTGINAGLVVVTADEPGQHSSQNEQDNRNYARAAKVPMLEPSDSQECIDMVKYAFTLSEEYDTPVLVRVTTRVCHSKSLVALSDRAEVPVKLYKKDAAKYVTVPANARIRRTYVEKRMDILKKQVNTSEFNIITDNNSKTTIIASGMCFNYAKEVFGNDANYLKIGFSYPLPMELIDGICKSADKIYVLEENDCYIEEAVRMLGYSSKLFGKYNAQGDAFFPAYGELTADVVRMCVTGSENASRKPNADFVVPRPPAFCAGCPHRAVFYELGKMKDVVVSGDIGCYTLGFAPPYNAMDFNCCMGASISSGSGMQKALDLNPENKKRVVSVLGDSTFFHSGITSLLDVVYNKGSNITIILDNRITGMTGHQQNPGSGFTLSGESAHISDIEAIVRAIGIEDVYVIDPNDRKAVVDTLNKAKTSPKASVIITKYPCVLKKLSALDNEQFPEAFKSKCIVNDKCVGCKMCVKCGCPAIMMVEGKAFIDKGTCVGCGVCMSICKLNAIERR